MLLVALFVALVFETGWWDNLDRMINERFRFHHLPHLLLCDLCQTWWLCLLYLIVSHNLSLVNVCLALAFSHLPQLIRPLFNLVKGYLLKAIEAMGKWL